MLFNLLFNLLFISFSHGNNNFISLSEELVEANLGYQRRQIIKLLIGNPPQKTQVKLSTAICGLCILDKNKFNHGFDLTQSSTFEALGITGKIDFARGTMSKDTMTFCGVESNVKIPFLLVDLFLEKSIPKNYDGLLGFGFQCRSASIGNVNLLKMFQNGGNVSKDIFAYQFDSKTGKGLFTLGGYPLNMKISNRHYRTAPLDIMNINGHWEVNLHSIYFSNNDMIKVDSPLSIGIGGAVFGVNEDIFNYIIQSDYFTFAFQKGVCQLTKQDVWEIYCDTSFDINSFGNLSLVIGKWTIKLKPNMLFAQVKKNNETRYWFSVVYYKDHNGQFYLSQTLLDGFNTVVYDRETYSLGIYQGEIPKQ